VSEWVLVTHASPRFHHRAVRRIDDCLAKELRAETDRVMRPFKWRSAVRHPDWETWLLGIGPDGGAIFTQDGLGNATWHLDRVWIAPHLRRQGKLAEIWPTWEKRYGRISIEPVTEAIREFLRHRGYGPRRTGHSQYTIPSRSRAATTRLRTAALRRSRRQRFSLTQRAASSDRRPGCGRC
jgi:hypothetical protein